MIARAVAAQNWARLARARTISCKRKRRPLIDLAHFVVSLDRIDTSARVCVCVCSTMRANSINNLARDNTMALCQASVAQKQNARAPLTRSQPDRYNRRASVRNLRSSINCLPAIDRSSPHCPLLRWPVVAQTAAKIRRYRDAALPARNSHAQHVAVVVVVHIVLLLLLLCTRAS